MMTSDAHRVEIDPAEGSPPELPAAPDSGLVLAYVPDAHAETCGRHLIEFAHRWRDEGHRVVLADARVASPILHVAAGVENEEGLTDLILHGTSLARVSVRIDEGVALVTAGTVTPDPGRVWAHPRWTTLVKGFDEVAGLLVVAVPADADVARLEGLSASTVRFHTDDQPDGVAAVPVDPGIPMPDALAAAGSASPASADRAGASGDPAAASDQPGSTDSVRTHGSARRAAEPESRGRTGLLLALLLVVVLSVLGAAWMGWVEIPGVTPVDTTVGSLPLL